MAREWKIALGENGFWSCNVCYGSSYTLNDILRHAKELNYDGIEIHLSYHIPLPRDQEEIKKIRKHYKERGLETPAIQSALGGSLADPNDDKRRKYVEELKKQIRLAADLSATCSVALYPTWNDKRRDVKV